MTPLKKLLFVDDDEDLLVIVRYCLKPLKGVEVKYATSGEAALAEAHQFQPDLILLDVMMPEIDGMTVLQELRKSEATSHIPIVFITAKVQKEEVDLYLKAGAIYVITKPFDPLTLALTIQKIWDTYTQKKG